MPTGLEHRVRPAPDVLTQEIAGESVLLNLNSEQYFGLDEIGTRVWGLIEQHQALRTVHAALLAEFDVAPERLERDLIELVDGLIAAGLLTLGEIDDRADS
jgi:hypothetical protein